MGGITFREEKLRRASDEIPRSRSHGGCWRCKPQARSKLISRSRDSPLSPRLGTRFVNIPMARPKTKAEANALLAEHRHRSTSARGIRVPHPYGPAMSALNPFQQRFVEIYVDDPIGGKKACIYAAGYKGTEMGAYAMGHRLMRNKLILDALIEASKAKMKSLVPNAMKAIEKVIDDPKHRDHTKASLAVLDRTGLHVVQEHKSVVEHTISEPVLLARVKAMAESLGIDASKLLPSIAATNQQVTAKSDETPQAE